MHPYRVFEDGVIECDGQLFFDDRDFAKYCEETEYAEEYWKQQEEIRKEEKLIDLIDRYELAEELFFFFHLGYEDTDT